MSLDKNYTEFIKVVKEKKMNWVHIFRDMEFYNTYGNQNGIPQIYLIDTAGNLIYSKKEENDNDMLKLKKLLRHINI